MRFADRRKQRLENRAARSFKRAHTRKTRIGRAAAAFRFSQVARRSKHHDRRIDEWRHNKKKRVRTVAKETGKHIALEVLPFVASFGAASPEIFTGEFAEFLRSSAAVGRGTKVSLAAGRAELGEQVVARLPTSTDVFAEAWDFNFEAGAAAAEIPTTLTFEEAARSDVLFKDAIDLFGEDRQAARQWYKQVRNTRKALGIPKPVK